MNDKSDTVSQKLEKNPKSVAVIALAFEMEIGMLNGGMEVEMETCRFRSILFLNSKVIHNICCVLYWGFCF